MAGKIQQAQNAFQLAAELNKGGTEPRKSSETESSSMLKEESQEQIRKFDETITTRLDFIRKIQ
jgi:hypothetical protein